MNNQDFSSSSSWRWPPLYIPNELEEDMLLSGESTIKQKTWIELLGLPQFNEEIDGNDIVREVDLHKFRIIYSCDTHQQAKDVYNAWIQEYETIGERNEY
jgi:hypothetical protein